jgi:hypothetical protein
MRGSAGPNHAGEWDVGTTCVSDASGETGDLAGPCVTGSRFCGQADAWTIAVTAASGEWTVEIQREGAHTA